MDLWTRIRPLTLPMPLYDQVSRSSTNADALGGAAMFALSLYLFPLMVLPVFAILWLTGSVASLWGLILLAGIVAFIAVFANGCYVADRYNWEDSDTWMARFVTRLARKCGPYHRKVEDALNRAYQNGASRRALKNHVRSYILLNQKEERIRMITDESHQEDKAKALGFIQKQKTQILKELNDWQAAHDTTRRAQKKAQRALKDMQDITAKLLISEQAEAGILLEHQAKAHAEKELAQISSKFS